MVSQPFWARGGLMETVRGEEGYHLTSTLLTGLRALDAADTESCPFLSWDAVVDS